MTALIALSALVLARGAPAPAPAPEEARSQDLQYLQGELESLDEQLRRIEPSDAKADEFRRRADEIREDVTFLKVKMRRAQRDGLSGTGVSVREVEDVRRSVGQLQDDIDRSFGEAHGHEDTRDAAVLRLPEGTAVRIRLETALSSRTAKAEERFDATVYSPVRFEGRLAIPTGTRVRGYVRQAEPAHRPSKAGQLDLDFDTLYVGTERLDLKVSVSAIEGNEGDSGTGKKAGIGAAIGGVLGGILGGTKGAIIGVAVGGGGAVVASRGEDVELPAGTIVLVRLNRPLAVPAPRR
jgi:hypothetical protein